MTRLHSSSRRRLRCFRVSGISFLVLIIVIGAAFFIYTASYYRTTDAARQALVADSQVQVTHTGRLTVFQPSAAVQAAGDPGLAHSGLVFYPGGKVAAAAYAPLLHQLAEQGVTCVLVRMPFNLAVFAIDAADQAMASQPAITDWTIAGHSLGGAMAAEYAARQPGRLRGLILLAAYPASDLSQTDLAVLTIWGSADGVLNRERLTAGKALLPDTASEYEITGGNHAQFGDYGLQKGDGLATIPSIEQQARTAARILTAIRQR